MNQRTDKLKAPGWPLKLLRRFGKKDYLEELEGDLEERFHDNLERYTPRKARQLYVLDACKLLRPALVRKMGGDYRLNQYGLLKNHLKVGIRNIFSRRSFAAINIVGLAIAFASFLSIHAYINYEKSYDTFHSSSKHIYRVDYKLIHKEQLLSHTATTPPALVPFIYDQVPGVTAFVRMHHYPDLVIRYGSSVFREDQVLMVDSSFFKIFDFKVLEGDPVLALKDRGAMMISKSTKIKYFGDQDAIGKTISIDGYEDYFITGVFADPPRNSHLQFDILLSFETARWWYEDETEIDWTSRDYYSYVTLDSLANVEDVVSILSHINVDSPQGFIDQQNEVKRVYDLTKLEDIHLLSRLGDEIDADTKGDGTVLTFLYTISIIILFIAWFNYINQSTARLFVRSREIGLRRVIGATKSNLVFQFFTESVLIHGLSLSIGLSLALVAQYLASDVDGFYFRLQFLNEPDFIHLFTLIFLSGFLVSSILPAIYISSFNQTQALKGNLKSGRKGQVIRKSLISFQLIASIFLITATIVIFLQQRHIHSQKLGFDIEKMLIVRGPTTSEANVGLFKSLLEQHPNITSVASGAYIPGYLNIEASPIARKDLPDLMYENIPTISVNSNYLKTLGVPFIAGRDFDSSIQSDTTSIILNRSTLNKLQFESAEEALEVTMQFGSGYKVKVIGVIEDYLQSSAKTEVLPLVFYLYPEESTNFLIRYTGREDQVKGIVKETFASQYQHDPFDYHYLSDYYQEQFKGDQQFSLLFLLFTMIAVLMACLGIFSLIYWSTINRQQEIGVRKVLGARVKQLIFLISRELLLLVFTSFIVAVPIVFYVMNDWLMNYASRISLNLSVFVLSFLFTLLVVVVTVGYRTYYSAIANPIDSLRDE